MSTPVWTRDCQIPNGRRRALSQLAGATASVLLGSIAATQAHGATITAAPMVHPALRRGINLTHWFEYEQAQAVSLMEMRQLRQLGMDHVRIPIDPATGGWSPRTGGLLQWMAALHSAIEQAIQSDLDVVVDLHLEPAVKKQIEDDTDLESALVTLWDSIGSDLRAFPASRLAFELFNEPQYYGWSARRWPDLQRRLLQSLRNQVPSHLVLLSGNEGGSLKGLRALPLVDDDPAVAYVFHYYAPFLFTHQGAQWLDSRYTTAGLRRGVLYPAQYQIKVPAQLLRPHPRAAKEMDQYLDDEWGPRRVRSDMDVAGRFAKEHNIRLVCNEFGVIRANVDVASRYRWIADVRSALEANEIGWTLWDYTDIFGITTQSAQPNRVGSRNIETPAIQALGLNTLVHSP